MRLSVNFQMEVARYTTALKTLSTALKRYHDKNVIILLDEYDVPLENAYYKGFYQEMVVFQKVLALLRRKRKRCLLTMDWSIRFRK